MINSETRIKGVMILWILSGLVGAFVQWRIFNVLRNGYVGPKLFIPLLGASGVDAPRTLALLFYGCVFAFLICGGLVLASVMLRRSRN